MSDDPQVEVLATEVMASTSFSTLSRSTLIYRRRDGRSQRLFGKPTLTATSADRTASGGGIAVEGDDIEVLELTVEQAMALVRQGDIMDAKTILLFYHHRLLRLSEIRVDPA